MAYLQQQAPLLNSRTLARRLTAIKNWHVYQGFQDPTKHPLVQKTLTGIKNVHGQPKEKAKALQLEQLLGLVNWLTKQDQLISWRNNALLQIGFFGAFRRSELVAIQYEQISFVSGGVRVLIPRSKTDQDGEGQLCPIPYGNEALCPVTALKTWLEKSGIHGGFIFRGITKNGNILNQGLSTHHFNTIIKNLVKECGFPDAEFYSSHSLRRGLATTASLKGASLNAIMRQGRWRHPGTALGYMEEGQNFKGNAASIVLEQPL